MSADTEVEPDTERCPVSLRELELSNSDASLLEALIDLAQDTADMVPITFDTFDAAILEQARKRLWELRVRP